MNSIIYKQTDSRWGKKAYPSGSTVGGCGCGLLACTHVAMEQESKKNWTPDNLRSWMVNKGFAIRGQGTRWEGITETLMYIGHKNVLRIYNDPMSEAWKELNKGNRIGVILFNSHIAPNGVKWTASGHYVAFTGYKYESNKHYFYTKDSGGRNHSGWYSYENSMRGCISKLWIVERVGKQATAATTTVATKAVTSDGKLVVDGVGGKATVLKLQKFLGVKETGGITIKKELHKYCPALKAVEYGTAGSGTVKYMQKWLGISQDGHWGASTSKALQKKLGVSQDGIAGKQTMMALQKYLNTNTKAVYPAATPTTTTKPASTAKTKGDKIADTAKSYVGKVRYVLGGTSLKTGIDCTGFIIAIYGLNGIKLTNKLSNWGASIGTSISKAQPGDIITFKNSSGKVCHHAIYIGGGRIVHAANPKSGVINSTVSAVGKPIQGIRRRWK